MKFPIEKVICDIKTALTDSRYVVVQAPPGAGKTTIVPIALLDEVWLSGKKIIMLEPRRIAARASAYRMSELINESIGNTIGYHISMDKCSGVNTRVEVITEGILTRRIQNDPSLEGVGLIIFDEFHERNLHSDLGLALALETCEVFSDALRLLVMSATIDTEEVSRLMGNAPVITSEGKTWPVETRYSPVKSDFAFFGVMEKKCAELIKQVLVKEEGDILVFLPGVGEIKRVEALLSSTITIENIVTIPLYGNLSKKEQDRAIFPSLPGERKIVLATSIAETSITIEGVSIVIDTGLMRVPRYYSGSGMSRLETISVSKASAEQRRGRAGRTKPGLCYRLWDESQHRLFKEFNTPEILNTDLTGFILELSLWGVSNINDLKFLNLPPESSVNKAKQILTDIGAIDSFGKITRHGKKMTGLGVHPRLAHMIIKGHEVGDGSLACLLAATLCERDIISFANSNTEADIILRLEILQAIQKKENYFDKNIKVNKSVALKILRNSLRFEKAISVKNKKLNLIKAGRVLAFAYPERILQLRSASNGRYLMANGSGAYFAEGDSLSMEKYIVAAELDGNPTNSKIYLGASYSKEELVNSFQDKLETLVSVKWDKKSKSVIAKKELKYSALVISRDIIQNADPELIASEMIHGIKETGVSCLPWNKQLRNYQARAEFLFSTGKYDDFPDISDSTLSKTLDVWLKPFIAGISKVSHLNKLDLKSILFSMFSWKNQQIIESHAPTHLIVPSGSKIPLRYITKENGVEDSPVLAVRLQELFGLKETPCVANGMVPVTIHLLSPASRPVQVTKDLRNFWENTYHEVKKELMGRYPKHYWPDDPTTAVPTNKTKKAR